MGPQELERLGHRCHGARRCLDELLDLVERGLVEARIGFLCSMSAPAAERSTRHSVVWWRERRHTSILSTSMSSSLFSCWSSSLSSSVLAVSTHPKLSGRRQDVPPVVSGFLSLPSAFVSSFFSASPLTALPLPLSAAVGFFSSSFAIMITKWQLAQAAKWMCYGVGGPGGFDRGASRPGGGLEQGSRKERCGRRDSVVGDVRRCAGVDC